MAKWNKLIITDAGYQLSAQTLAGNKIQYTHAQTTDKDMSNLTSDQLKSITKLYNVVQDLPIGTISVQDDHTVNVPVKVMNNDLQEDYLLSGIALFAKTIDGNEILYGIATSVNPDLIPAQNGSTVVGTTFNLKVHIGDAANVNIVISPDGSVSNEELEGILKAYVLETNLDALLQSKNYASKDYVDQSIKDATPKLPDNLVSLSSDNTTVTATTKDGKQTGVWVTQETLDSLAKDTNVVHRNPDTGSVGETLDFTLSNIMASGHKFMVYDEAPDEETALAQSKVTPGVFQIYTED